MTNTVEMLLSSIVKMLHSEPEIQDPATNQLCKLIDMSNLREPNLKRYYLFLQTQANRFRNRYLSEIEQFSSV